MKKIWVIHGPNLNRLGQREPGVYGHTTLEDINKTLKAQADANKVVLETYQSNAEHELIEKIQGADVVNIDFILINPAAFTHTSVALRDALSSVNIPFIEVHLSNVHAREPFRQCSYFSDIAQGVICGFGATSYSLALTAALELINIQTST